MLDQDRSASFGGSRAWCPGLRRCGGVGARFVALAIGAGLVGELLATLFFLLVSLCQIPLALFELVVWLGQDASCDFRKT